MPQKVVLVADPGIDTAFAIALALHDPGLDVIGLIATAGNIPAVQATQNVHVLINQLEPERWPRLGAALPIQYDIDGTKLHGPDGLGGQELPPITLHHPTPGDKLLVELVRARPKEVTVVLLGPATTLATAFERDPELPAMVGNIVVMGGSWKEPGNATAVAEFHFYCDPVSARRVLQCGAPITLIPLDVTRKLIFSPSDLLALPAPESPTCQFLRKIVPYGIRASSNLYGIEGFHLKDVLGVVALALPLALTLQDVYVDVEVKGELTRGMSVVDARPLPSSRPNVHMATNVDAVGVQDYIKRTLSRT
jgi:inosine-uridine nucleoside N-ribohydrolase